MHRAVSILLAVAGIAFATDASARPKFSFGGLKAGPKPAVASTSAAAPAVVRPGGRTVVVAPRFGRNRQNEESTPDAAAQTPALLSAPTATAAATSAAASRTAETPQTFKARCDSSQGSIVGATTHGFCVFN